MKKSTAFDDRAITLGHPSYVWREGQERRLAMIREVVSLEGARILDLGCGLGMYVHKFHEFSDEVYGVDVDAERVQEALRTLPNIYESTAEQLPFDSDFFGLVLSNEVFEHVTDDRQAVREAVRVLRPGGSLVVFVPNRGYFFETHGFYWRGKYHFGNIPLINYLPTKLRNKLCPHVRAYKRADLRALFEGLDGEIVVHRCIFAGYDNIMARRPRLGRFIRCVSYAMESSFLQWLGLSHFLVFRKSDKAA